MEKHFSAKKLNHCVAKNQPVLSMAQKYLLLNFDRSQELRGQQLSSECILVVVVEAVVGVAAVAVAFVADVVVAVACNPPNLY